MKLVKSALMALMLCWVSVAIIGPVMADVAVPPLTGRVVDLTNTLSSSDADFLSEKLKAFEYRKGSQVAVLIVPTTQPETIEQYSLRVVEQWKLGRKKIDDGVLLIVAKDDRKLRIEVGYGLEGALNDATAKRIIDEIITPKFKSGDFSGGISEGADKIMSVIDGEPLPAPEVRRQQVNFDAIGDAFPFLLVASIIGGGLLRALFGRLMGALVGGGIAGVIAWFALGVWPLTFLAAGIVFILTVFGDTIFSGSGGGSGGGFSSSSGSSGGGFSGGGGSFGGGGASGSW